MKYWQLVTGLLVAWLLVIMYMSNSVFPNASDTNLRTERQLQRALDELEKLRNQNLELHSLAKQLRDLKFEPLGSEKGQDASQLREKLDSMGSQLQHSFAQTGAVGAGPSLEHEVARREMEHVSGEFWLYIHAELTKMKEAAVDPDVVRTINRILAMAGDIHMTLRNKQYQLSEDVDAAGDWRKAEAARLTDLVQRRIAFIQNPSNCEKAKKILCNLGKGCGYGCQLHHVTYCLMTAYASQRTLILQSEGWRYAARGWESVFLPLSNTCHSTHGQPSTRWGPGAMTDNTMVLELPIVDSLSPRPRFLPLAIPEDLGDRLTRVSGDPSAWWIGQFVTYLTRPNTDMQAYLENSKQKLGFESPIVGVHVRRTDKVGMEAQFHSLDEYMGHVEDWFNTYEKRHPDIQRRVFLASDDPEVLQEAKRNYPNYIFVSDTEASKTAGLGSRYTDASLRGIVLDTYLLSRCDFLVCTFSSQVCRVGYELMQPLHGDASQWFRSLDDIFYYGGQNAHNWEAVENHDTDEPGEISFRRGDLIGIAGNHWNGFSKGKNTRNGKTGLFPSYKTVNKIERFKMPTYPKVKEL
ncbi:alpha-(1,6)-fucosyltransferase-like [Mya arenaria]|uniref:alpha-(1,6)-fucosyltransferase-like n=1 Tax=Mya arenaria TaxID=6604 RepID=UPI0022DF037F|nr:alpha-(1,6)-fucosyltransferase-like [Mya arenaria]